MTERAIIFIKGFCMGAADVVPGVSGGTMAFILGIYERLVTAIRAFDAALLRYLWHRDLHSAVRHIDLLFLIPLVLGILAALMFFTRIVSLPTLIQTHPELIYSLFFGLVMASVYVLLREIQGLGLWGGAILLGGIALGLTVVNLVPVETPETPWFILISGALAICAMILPGISGSFILLILRKYAYIFDGIGRLDFGIIVPFGVGAVIGLMLFSRTLVWLLRHYYQHTLILITGLLIGSLWVIWPFQERAYEVIRGKSRLIHSTPVWPGEVDATIGVAVGLMIIGMMVVLWLNTLAGKKLRST